MSKKLVGWAIVIVAAIAVYTWWKSRKGTVPVTSTDGNTAAPPSLAGTGTELQFLGQLPGLNFGN